MPPGPGSPRCSIRPRPPRPGIHPSAVIDPAARVDPSTEIGPLAVIGPGAEIGPRCRIGPGAVIGAGVVLGAECRIGAQASLSHALLGDRVVVFPGARIGQEGFGFAPTASGFISVPQLGRVVIEHDVEIGANSTIDRGSLRDTVIGAGSRLDNLVQIGHNVRIGRLCVIVAQVGISGSTILEDHVMIGGQAGTGRPSADRPRRAHRRPGGGDGRRARRRGVVGGSPAQPLRASASARSPCCAGWRTKAAPRESSWESAAAGRRGMTEIEPPGAGERVESIDIARIMHAIPHRYPFLMIDRVVELVRDRSAIGVKNVSVNESFFQGHFPNHPVMPGVLIIESMAQTAAVLVVETLGPEAAGGWSISCRSRARSSAARWCRATSSASMSSRNAIAATCGSSTASPGSTACRWPRPPTPP